MRDETSYCAVNWTRTSFHVCLVYHGFILLHFVALWSISFTAMKDENGWSGGYDVENETEQVIPFNRLENYKNQGRTTVVWVVNAKIHLQARNLGDTIKEGNFVSSQGRTKVMIFILRSIHKGLKSQYLSVKDLLRTNNSWVKVAKIWTKFWGFNLTSIFSNFF